MGSQRAQNLLADDRVDEQGRPPRQGLRLVAVLGVVAVIAGVLWLLRPPPAPVSEGSDDAAAVTPTLPSTRASTQQFLSGMDTEEVEPGVLRVLRDGHRDLTHPSVGYPWDCQRVIVGDNDLVWRTTGCWEFYQLGHSGEWEGGDLGWGRGFASRDGRLWSLESGGPSPEDPYYLRLFDAGEWVPDPRLDGPTGPGQVHVAADGTVWFIEDDAVQRAGDGPAAGETVRAGSPSEVWVGEGDRDGVSLLSVTDDGVVWLVTEAAEDGSVAFLRFDAAESRVVPGPEGLSARLGLGARAAAVSPDGVLWTAGDALAPHGTLARWDEDGWTVFDEADGVQPWGGQRAWWGTKMDTVWAAPDGSVWVNASTPDILMMDGNLGCDGLARFDGETWQSFLSGRCISDLGFSPDDSVWVVAREPQGSEVHTYVISG